MGHGNVFAFRGGECNFGLHFALPHKRAPGVLDNEARARIDRGWVIRVLTAEGASEVGVNKAFELAILSFLRLEDETFVGGSSKITGNPFGCSEVSIFGVIAETGTLVNRECDVWSCSHGKIVELTNEGAIMDLLGDMLGSLGSL